MRDFREVTIQTGDKVRPQGELAEVFGDGTVINFTKNEIVVRSLSDAQNIAQFLPANVGVLRRNAIGWLLADPYEGAPIVTRGSW